jgi:hypothetical protein
MMDAGREGPQYSGRQHPWTEANHDSRGRYYDFKTNPELIPLVLEDLKPYEGYAAVRTFYDLLAEVNGPTSNLETNDISFRGPSQNVSDDFAKDLQCMGRLAVLFRELDRNCAEDDVSWFMARSLAFFWNETPALQWGHVKVSTWDHLFSAIGKEGVVVLFRFWAWGDSDYEAMANLDIVLHNMAACLRTVSLEASQSNHN